MNTLLQLIKDLALPYIFEESVKKSVKFLKEKRLKISNNGNDFEQSLIEMTSQIDTWSKQISFNDLNKAKRTSEVFIEIDIFLMPLKTRIDDGETINKISCLELFKQEDRHFVIVGQPGAGKTTLMKFLCQSVMYDEKFYPTEFRIPILIRLRELNGYSGENSVLINHLFYSFGLVIDEVGPTVKESEHSLAKKRILFSILDSLEPLIILDGFDELSTSKLKSKILEEFREIALTLRVGKVILTSRGSDYNYSVDNTATLEISPLSDLQIQTFASKWLNDANKVKDFLDHLYRSPFADTSIRPLTLSHLCAIYERSGRIPEKPKTIYKKIINLLLEEWDEQREVKRLTEYGGFEVDRKLEFLAMLAYEITIAFRGTVFSEDQLKRIYHDRHNNFNLPKTEASKVVKELESHSGLILQSGFKTFEFAHKSLHEYLCAEYLVKLPVIPRDLEVLTFLPNELAIAISISSEPSAYFCELVFYRFVSHRRYTSFVTIFSNDFFSTFVNRMVLEKPDFNTSEEVSFALVVLYTLFRQNGMGQLELFDSNLTMELEKFVLMIFERNKKFEYTKFYSIYTTHRLTNDEEIIELRMTHRGGSYNNLNYTLPYTLFAKKSFITGY